jgi:hypothetical protein
LHRSLIALNRNPSFGAIHQNALQQHPHIARQRDHGASLITALVLTIVIEVVAFSHRSRLLTYEQVARIKKIINTDEDISNCSNNAAFVMTIATEMFIQYLSERSFEIVKAEKRGKKSLQYIDIGKSLSCFLA